MTENQGTTTTAPPPPPIRRFRRSRTDRTFQGVCGGIAEALAMDPVIVRVLMVVLTFFGGAGVVIYGACWVLMPEDDRETSLAERAIAKGGRNPWPVLLGVGALSLAALIGLGWFIDDRGALLIALVVVGAILLARRQADTAAAAPPPPFPSPPYTASPAFNPTPVPVPANPWTETAPGSFTTAPSWDPAPSVPPLPPLPDAQERPRPFLGRLVFCLIMVGLGLLGTIDLMGADVDASAYPALVVAGAGLGLLVGTRWGRARWLIPLGIVGALALPPTLFVDCYEGNWVDQSDSAVAPASTAGLAPEYSYRGGRVVLDLSKIDFTNADVATKLRIGAGYLTVTVPADVDVVTNVDLVAGDAEVFGEEHDGLGVELDRSDNGADGVGGGRLRLDVEQGFGQVEVRRVAA